MRFKLIAGQHIGPDKDMKPNKDGRYPSRVYKAGEPGNDIIEDDLDLEKRFGREKFVRLDDNRRKARDQERVTDAMKKSPQVQQAEEGPQEERAREAIKEEKARESGQPVPESKQQATVVKPGDGKDFAEAASKTQQSQPNPSTPAGARGETTMPGRHDAPQAKEKFKAPDLPAGTKPPQNKEEYFSILDKMSHQELKGIATQEGLAPGNKSRAELLKMLKEDADSGD